MKKNRKKILLSFGAATLILSTGASVVSCALYSPRRSNVEARKFLSSKFAYNKVVADYYKSTVNMMYQDIPKNGVIKNININNLRFDTYQWLIDANAIQDQFYWGNQRTDWMKNGAFTGSTVTSADGKTSEVIKTLQDNKDFINGAGRFATIDPGGLFKMDIYNNYLLKNDMNTFYVLGGNPDNYNDLGSGVIMNLDRKLYTMGYLLLTNPKDVQHWLIGDPNNPQKHTPSSGMKLDEVNNGQYFLIDYLRAKKPFIMWKNTVKDTTIPDASFINDMTTNITTFNKMSNTLELQNSLSDSLTLPGGNIRNAATATKPSISELGQLTSYVGFSTTNPFLSFPSGIARSGDVNPDWTYMTAKGQDGGFQGWVNNDGSINANKGGPVRAASGVRNYAYIQQLLPQGTPNKAGKNMFNIPNWMTTTKTSKIGNNTPVESIWNVAFQVAFYGSSTLKDAKNFWTNNGYYLTENIQTLIDNMSAADLDKYKD